MISVKFKKDFADKFKGEVVQFTEQLASYLVNVDMVATYDLDEELPEDEPKAKAKAVKPKTKK
jgi:hypothetical protein